VSIKKETITHFDFTIYYKLLLKNAQFNVL